MISVPFSIIENDNISRVSQPVSIGFPFVIGELFNSTQLAIRYKNDHFTSCQITPLNFWHDGSVKWATIDLVIDIEKNKTLLLELVDDFPNKGAFSPQGKVKFSKDNKRLQVNTGASDFYLDISQGEILSIISSELNCDKDENIYFQLIDSKNEQHKAVIDKVCVELIESKTNRKSLTINGRFVGTNDNSSKLKFESKLTFFANTTYIKVDFTLHNPQAAQHPGGLWDLGDDNSILFESLSLNISVDENATVKIYDHVSNKEIKCGENSLLSQFSSGGVNWNSPVHKNSSGNIDIKRNGFVINSTNEEQQGNRISPCFSVNSIQNTISIYIEKFWQNFPKVLSKQDESLNIALFPKGNFELQGGEKKSHTMWIDFKSNNQIFDWVDKPLNVTLDPNYLELTCAVEYFQSNLKQDHLSKIIEKGITGAYNFFEKRETVDEYGWRNFGDLYADHETEGFQNSDIFVSHYNNQYDPIYGFIYQYLISRNSKYFELANDLANHVTDIDIYHTSEDRDEYNNGLFWHTDHYLDASTCTHRTYSKNHKAAYEGYTSGGGPGGQHCYTTGLKLHYLLTGNENSKQAVLKLSDWITFSYEGSNSLSAKMLAIKKSGETGLKNHLTNEYPMDRGTGHYIIALLDSFDLSRNNSYLDKVFNIIKNTFHPCDDISTRNFSNIEDTWFYTVFLQAVGRFLLTKEQLVQLDDDFYYARDSLLHYVDWMCENEKPYLAQKDKLEFPNATWAGQDLRKVGLFYMASYYLSENSGKYQVKAEYFYQYIIDILKDEPSSKYTRIKVLLMQNIGFVHFYREKSNHGQFGKIKQYQKPKKQKKWLVIASLIIKELSRISIRNELKWISLRSTKAANLLGKKF